MPKEVKDVFVCEHCGKKIISKHDVCPYCGQGPIIKKVLIEKYGRE